MTLNESYLYNVRQALGSVLGDGTRKVTFIPPDDWNDFLTFAVKQGIGPLIADAILPLSDEERAANSLTRELIKRCVSVYVNGEEKYEKNFKVAQKLSSYYDSKGVRMVVLKGLSLASLYPRASARVSSDLDIFLFEDYELGNSLVESLGVKVLYDHYKHSSFCINGLPIENHRFCTAVRSDKRVKALEKCLEGLLQTETLESVGECKWLRPGMLFNSLFYLEHTRTHFLHEGISLRFIVDWIVIRRHMDASVSGQLEELVRKFGLLEFRDTIDRLGDYLLGEDVELTGVDRRVLDDTLLNTRQVIYHNGLRTTLQIVLITLRSGWKYSAFSDKSMPEWLLFSLWGKIFEKSPGLD